MTQAKPKRGLGRGLDALFGESEAVKTGVTDAPQQTAQNDTGSAPKTISILNLKPGVFQPRRNFDQDALNQLVESVKAHGILQPLLVRPLQNEKGRFEIIAGERRWRAAQAARLHEVPVVVQELSDVDALQIALIENLQREDLNPLEEAEGYARLIEEFSYSQEKLAQQLGKSRSHIANMMRLLKLPPAVRRMVLDGKLSAGHARALLSAADPVGLAEQVIKEDLSVRATERLVTSPEKQQARLKKKLEKDVDTLALEKDVSNRLGMKITIDGKGKKGVLKINYQSLDQLDDLLRRLRA